MTKLFALVDCNNFYVSCEQAFNPSLIGRPVVVLSNNDGCAISRSEEAKHLGIGMGVPLFKVKDIVESKGVVLLSSNYDLYGDISNRVMMLLKDFTPKLEVYSIDEAFLDLSFLKEKDIEAYADKIRKHILKCLGIPISIGIARTKTLAKLASKLAKHNTNGVEANSLNSNGVKVLTSPQEITDIMGRLDVSDLWGIGRKWSLKLRSIGVNTALDLCNMNPFVLDSFNVVFRRTVNELKGIACLKLEEVEGFRKNILSSRSFGRNVTSIEELEEAISTYAASACKKLRQQESRARAIYVFIRGNRFREREYHFSSSISFIEPTCDTRHIISEAKALIKSIYKEGCRYKKAGIILLDLVPRSYNQMSLIQSAKPDNRLMQLLDSTNKKHGNGTLFIAAEGIEKPWQMKSTLRSAAYTSKWEELLRVR